MLILAMVVIVDAALPSPKGTTLTILGGPGGSSLILGSIGGKPANSRAQAGLYLHRFLLPKKITVECNDMTVFFLIHFKYSLLLISSLGGDGHPFQGYAIISI